jgi:hypothetical protein
MLEHGDVDANDPRRPSVEDLALTENLIPSSEVGDKQTTDQVPEVEDEDDLPIEYSVRKLSELDPRFVSEGNGDGNTTTAGAGGGLTSDTESLSGIPYRRLDRKNKR